MLSLVLLVLAGGFFLRNKSNGTKITTARVQRGNFAETVTASGKTVAKKQITLKFQTSGLLSWVGVKEGDRVEAYQTIAKLDTREVEENLKKVLIDYVKQRNDFEEMWRVTYKGISNPQAALTDTIKRILEKNQWDLDKAVADVEIKNLAVRYATLVTPIKGVVTHIDTPIAGVNITPATAEFEIADPQTVVFRANIDEIDVAKLNLNQPVEIALDSLPDTILPGTVSYIAYAAEVTSGGATVFPVEATFDSSSVLRIGFNGDITIKIKSVENVLLIPSEAVREENGEKFVFRREDKKFNRIKVETGPTNEDETVILSGINENDQVVVKGFTQLPK